MKRFLVLAVLTCLCGACKKDNLPDYNLISEQILAVKDYTPTQRSLIFNWCKEHRMVIYDVDRSIPNQKESIQIIADIQEPLEFGEHIAFLKQKLLSDNPKCEMSWRGENNIYTFTLKIR
jgi:hypothetical protein